MKPILALLMTAALLISVPARAGAAWPDQSTAQRVDALVQQVMRETHIPGIAVGIVEGDQAVFLKGYGEAAPGRPVTPQTPFILGSLSKSFTAIAAMQMVDAGKLDLDAPVQRYLPWFRVADEAASAQITVRHLLNHKSGLPRDAAAFLGPLDDRTNAEWIVRHMANLKLTAAPGAQFQYCNLNYITVALIVETLAGIPFDQYIQQRVLAPLQMTHSFTAEAPARADGLAAGHYFLGGILPVPHRAPYSRGRLAEGYVIASAEDMTRYLRALIDEGANILPPSRVAELFTPAAGMGPGQGAYGMGWAISTPGGTLLYQHDGETPTFRSAMAILPGSKRGLIVLANASTDATGGVPRLAGALVALLRDQTPLLAPARVPASAYLKLIAPTVALLWALWDLLRLPRWRRRLRERGTALAGDYAVTAFSLVLAVVLMAGVPVAVGGAPALMWAVDPYTTAEVFGAGGLALIACGCRSLILWKRRIRPATARDTASA